MCVCVCVCVCMCSLFITTLLVNNINTFVNFTILDWGNIVGNFFEASELETLKQLQLYYLFITVVLYS